MYNFNWLLNDGQKLLKLADNKLAASSVPAAVIMLQQDLVNHYKLCATLLERDSRLALEQSQKLYVLSKPSPREFVELAAILKSLIKITGRLLQELLLCERDDAGVVDMRTPENCWKREYSNGYIVAKNSVSESLLTVNGTQVTVRTFPKGNLMPRGISTILSEKAVAFQDLPNMVSEMNAELNDLESFLTENLMIASGFYNKHPNMVRSSRPIDSYLIL